MPYLVFSGRGSCLATKWRGRKSEIAISPFGCQPRWMWSRGVEGLGPRLRPFRALLPFTDPPCRAVTTVYIYISVSWFGPASRPKAFLKILQTQKILKIQIILKILQILQVLRLWFRRTSWLALLIKQGQSIRIPAILRDRPENPTSFEIVVSPNFWFTLLIE